MQRLLSAALPPPSQPLHTHAVVQEEEAVSLCAFGPSKGDRMQAQYVWVSPEPCHGLGLTLHLTDVLLVQTQVLGREGGMKVAQGTQKSMAKAGELQQWLYHAPCGCRPRLLTPSLPTQHATASSCCNPAQLSAELLLKWHAPISSCMSG